MLDEIDGQVDVHRPFDRRADDLVLTEQAHDGPRELGGAAPRLVQRAYQEVAEVSKIRNRGKRSHALHEQHLCILALLAGNDFPHKVERRLELALCYADLERPVDHPAGLINLPLRQQRTG